MTHGSSGEAEHPPSAGDNSDFFAGNQLPSCVEDGCQSDVEYVTQDGGLCELHAWSRGIQRWTEGRDVEPGTEDSDST